MTDDNQTPNNQTEQSPMDYQETQAPQTMEQSETTSLNDARLNNERAAFETYLETSGEQVPENFADAGAYFDSLKEAQKKYTQGQQEISTLRQQMQTPPPTEAPVAETTTPSVEADPNAELRITAPEVKEEEPTSPFANVNQDAWDDWAYEVATTGNLSDVTKSEIQKTTGLSDTMISEFLAGQKAKMRESYQHAASVVGGREELQGMLKWASESLSEEERFSINAGLSNKDLNDITLRGLSAKYNAHKAANPKKSEPIVPSNREAVSNTSQTYPSYQTKREFVADRNNPRFSMEPKFRAAVEQRMIKTNWNTLPE